LFTYAVRGNQDIQKLWQKSIAQFVENLANPLVSLFMKRASLQESKNIIMVAHDFPPEGNAGSYRPLRFVRHLIKHNWTPTVVSAIPRQYERLDPALLASIPRKVEVIRIEYSDMWQSFQAWRSKGTPDTHDRDNQKVESAAADLRGSLRSWLRDYVRTIEAWWYHPDMASPWLKAAVEATIEAGMRKRASVIWATAGPVTSFYVAWFASRRTNIPYVLDFRDAWTITHNDFEARRPAWAIRRDREKMFELLKGAQAVVFRYDSEAECFWHAYRGALDVRRIHIIPNGYESPIDNAVPPAGDKCTILYAGTMSDYRYDTLLEALKVLKRTNPDKAKCLRLSFIGEGMDALAIEAGKLNLADVIETAGRKSHAEIRSLEQEAHALLILGRPATMKGYELFAGAKLFGYLKAGRPIVGVLPEDETRNILQRLGVSTLADVNSVQDIMAVLCSVIDNWSMGRLSSILPDRKACEAYSSEQQTKALVRALEAVPSEKPFIPGAQRIPASLRANIEDLRVSRRR
jgi:glycosyltransferase involved in cell wall biosynthesis